MHAITRNHFQGGPPGLLVQHIGTTGTGSNIVRKHQINKNGRSCYVEIKSHFQNASYKENLASAVENKIRDAKYYGDRRNFTLETYYTVMTGSFNDLELAGTAHALTEEHKITKFESGLASRLRRSGIQNPLLNKGSTLTTMIFLYQ